MDTDREKALRVVHAALGMGISPEEVVFEVVVPAIELMMKSISENQGVSLAQHFMAAQIASEVVDEMVPRFRKSAGNCRPGSSSALPRGISTASAKGSSPAA